jgi:homoserine kinase
MATVLSGLPPSLFVVTEQNKQQLLQDWKKQVVHHEGKSQADQNLEQLVKVKFSLLIDDLLMAASICES